jgi:hypothetical protein
MNTARELKSFHFVFQISGKIVFEVNYYRLGNNKTKHFSTSAAQFNQPKTDYNRCGQAQHDLLKGAPAAMRFFKKWDTCHVKDLTPEQHTEVLQDIEELKAKYNYLETEKDASFSKIRELAMQPVKK